MQLTYRSGFAPKHHFQQNLSCNYRCLIGHRPIHTIGDVKSSVAAGEAVINVVDASPVDGIQDQETSIVTCPICQTTNFDVFNPNTKGMKLNCEKCNRTFEANKDFVDLTITSGYQASTYQEQQWSGTELFRSPFVSFLYERGWRQNFITYGAPGPDVEFNKAMEFLKDVKGGTLLDISCGSGLFTRRFLTSREFQRVIALDFSESMLRETKQRVENQSASQYIEDLSLIRADVGRLPLKSSSLSAIYSGAAIHCWPSPQQAFTEISRVLKPGGVFVASTFLFYLVPFDQILGDQFMAAFKRIQRPFRNPAFNLLIERDLKDLAESVGLENFQKYQQGRFILFSVTKPKLQ
eukprot:TRINITY_DN1637_c0_g1_i5.p1 TRINITY_DN1637_c0_g1~~TRINITY_DN1637_c0_g1_i5.p1  ORF type:complete len:351 (-),score=29.71 TRINITY_DN1637_c0_g1_i5:178-1230(-)